MVGWLGQTGPFALEFKMAARWFLVLLYSVPLCLTTGLDTDYLNEHCDKTIQKQCGGRLELTRSLYYTDNLHCTVVLRVNPGQKILLQYKRFEVEGTNDRCYDTLDIYEGDVAGTNATSVISGTRCGYKLPENIVTSGDTVTLKFNSDNSGYEMGFEIIYTSFSEPPCTGDTLSFLCENVSRCVCSSVVCDGIDHCGTGEDESSDLPACSDAKVGGLNVEALIGILIGIAAALALASVGGWYWYKRTTERGLLFKGVTIEKLESYPRTNRYNKHRWKHVRRKTSYGNSRWTTGGTPKISPTSSRKMSASDDGKSEDHDRRSMGYENRVMGMKKRPVESNMSTVIENKSPDDT
ncbi:uncharacterized protein LOC118418509 [Branchiostoma floridae]|uniref:Uncharacterized protein LOC118418509 n=1 Tax=Branchiostoma floridae TaxID=7739 RepID=A0A9J7LCI4_BRAFL|nr:uncharacterized protein LOC118418509 [Branchiostoma floridae]